MTEPWQQASEEFACDHPRTELTVKVAVNGTRIYRHQCQVCGQGLEVLRHSALPSLQRDHAIPFDETLKNSWWQRKSERARELYDEKRERESSEWWRAYQDHQASPEWQMIRMKVLKRAGFVCEGCLSRPATQVHHKTYERVGREMAFDLVAVCDVCHETLHGAKNVEVIR